MKIKKNCPYLKVGAEHISITDDLYTSPLTTYFCKERDIYIDKCPEDCLWKTHADAGGHYVPTPETCFFCSSENFQLFKRDIIKNKNINKILIPEELEEIKLCPIHVKECIADPKEIIGFRVNFEDMDIQDFVNWFYDV